MVRADTDAVPSSVRRFMARDRRRRLEAALPWAVAAAIAAVVGLLGWVVYGTSVLGVRDVRVVGARTVDAVQVREAAAVPALVPLARVDLDAVRRRVQALPPVYRAVVRRSWPRTIVVEVVERTGVAAVPLPAQGQAQEQGQFALIDDDGVAFRTVTRVPAGLPLARLARPGPGDVNTRAALTVLTSLTGELREQLVAVSVPAPAQVQLELRKGRTIVWGDDTENEAKARVATALLNREGQTIDVSAPEVVTIR